MRQAVLAGRPLRGTLRVPGDKSIAHRALLLAAMAPGVSSVSGVPDSLDVRATLDCLKRLGVGFSHRGSTIRIAGRGGRGFLRPRAVLDAGGSGTTARLLMGLLAGQTFETRLTGDSYLRRRPMGRVAGLLRRMGARVALRGDRLPASIEGAPLRGIRCANPVPSAQLKSAVLIAGLLATGETSISESALSRDHTERLLPLFGARLRRRGLTVTITGQARLRPARLTLPGDASSAAFWVVAASLVPGSRLRLKAVGCNPTRTGFLRVLKRMGARIEMSRPSGRPDPVCDLVVRPAGLTAVVIGPAEVPALIDEIPILALAASQARGLSRFRGVSELRHKESDRLAGTVRLLRSFGAKAWAEGDDLVIAGPARLRGARFDPAGDHRLAMAAAVAGLAAEGRTVVLDAGCAAASYPGFWKEFQRLSNIP